MKSIKILSLIGILFLAISASAQTPKDIFDPNTKIVWLGLDFTKARIVDENVNFDSIKNMVRAWNILMTAEPDKFDIGKALHRPKLEEHLEVAIEHNATLNFTSDSSRSKIKGHDVDSIVASYDYKNLHGVGVLFIVDEFSKPVLRSFIWVTFINMDKKKSIFTEQLLGKPVGFGVRNYWAGAIYSMLKNLRRNEYEDWQSKYKD